MREILFRGKRTDNGEWVEGSLSTEYLKECGCVMISPTADTCYKVDPETVGQYTGLTDKNGVKIFEGDIVKHYDAVYEIRYITKYTRCAGRNSGCIFAGIPLGNTEVIGNIHDNPELLETATKPAAKNIAQSGLAPATENFELMEVENG